MKRSFFLIVMISATFSCSTKNPGKDDSRIDTSIVSPIDTGKTTNTTSIITDTHYFWASEWNTKSRLVMKKTNPISKDSLTPVCLIQKLNKSYPEIGLQFIKISNDSIFVAIRKSAYLTQQMGSSGAEAYLAEVTYNLTELKNINCVNMRFKKGDHASPGTYSRTDFIEANN